MSSTRYRWEQSQGASIAGGFPALPDNVEEIESIRPERPRPFGVQVVAVTFGFFMLVFFAAALFVYGIDRLEDRTADGVMAVAIGLGFSCVLCIPVYFWRVGVYDRELRSSSQWAKFREPTPAQQEQRAQPWLVKSPDGYEQIVIGSFKFTEKEWRRLAQSLLNHDWRVTRKSLGAAGVFKNLPDTYQNVIGQFIEVGWLPPSSTGNADLLPAGVSALRAKLPPTLSYNGVSSGGTGSTTTTTTETTGDWED